ncbi:hypothetical protein BMW23_0473 [Bodo saltans virus]|uniref:Uncharacterized protein n=1 Tax=Bodo saltans virus TaxID=2024608 RepID=A0A2H4UUM4_9VIRU|nr:hypothetical protein QJ851_gp0462 [Bodo saltans virus]ATZ80525.1 hypothetical protein BMW23_0473 [Bodo saltans virus]
MFKKDIELYQYCMNKYYFGICNCIGRYNKYMMIFNQSSKYYNAKMDEHCCKNYNDYVKFTLN